MVEEQKLPWLAKLGIAWLVMIMLPLCALITWGVWSCFLEIFFGK